MFINGRCIPEKEINMQKDRELWQSQNFLRRPNFVANLVETADINSGDLVVEIGPGRGIITQQLATKSDQVIAVEIDKNLAANLQSSLRSFPNIQIIENNFLRWELPDEHYKVFSNIPFNMTADIVKKLTEDQNPPEVAYLIMQDKAMFRFMGKPRESQVSILLKPWFKMRVITNINKNEFVPVPKVNVVLAELRKRKQPLVEEQFRQWYRDFVVYGYNQWQPTILDAFKDVFTSKQRHLLANNLEIKKTKPSDLTITQWLKLFEVFMAHTTPEGKKVVEGSESRLRKQQKGLKKLHRTR